MESSNDNGASGTTKRKCLQFSMQQKLESVKRMDAGESTLKIAQEMGLNPSTLRKWRRNKRDLEQFGNAMVQNRKRMRTAANPQLDLAVHDWFVECRFQGLNVSGTQIKAKAVELNEILGGEKRFSASDGWLSRWKIRHGVKCLDQADDGLILSEEISDEYTRKLLEIFREDSLTPSHVFNLHKTTMCFKTLPQSDLPTEGNRPTNDYRFSRDGVTIMACCNADATFKLPLMIVGKSEKPRGLKNLKKHNIPVYYTHEGNSNITNEIFNQWFTSEFVPRVLKFLKKVKALERAILIVDNDEFPVENVAARGVRTILVPSDVANLVQPITKDAFDGLRTHYTQRFCSTLIAAQKDGTTLQSFLKCFNVRNFVFSYQEMWNRLKLTKALTLWPDLPNTVHKVRLRSALPTNDTADIECAVVLPTETEELLDSVENATNSQNFVNDSMIIKTDPEDTRTEHINFIKVETNIEREIIDPADAIIAIDSLIEFFEYHGGLMAGDMAALRRAKEQAILIDMYQ